MYLVWCDYYQEAKNWLSYKNSVFNGHWLIYGKCKMTPENTTNDTFLCTSKKIYFPFHHRSKVLICHSRDTNERLCSEKPPVAIILRYINKMTGLYTVLYTALSINHNFSNYRTFSSSADVRGILIHTSKTYLS